MVGKGSYFFQSKIGHVHISNLHIRDAFLFFNSIWVDETPCSWHLELHSTVDYLQTNSQTNRCSLYICSCKTKSVIKNVANRYLQTNNVSKTTCKNLHIIYWISNFIKYTQNNSERKENLAAPSETTIVFG